MGAPYEYVTEQHRVPAIVQEVTEAEAIGLDLETTNLDPREGEVSIVSVNTGKGVYVLDAFALDLTLLWEALHNPGCATGRGRPIVIGHNLGFDQKWLYHHYKVELFPVFDTFRASVLIYCGRTIPTGKTDPETGRPLGKPYRHDLYTVYKRELNEEPHGLDDHGGSDWKRRPLPKGQLDYAADDVARLLRLRRALREKLVKYGLMRAAGIEFNVLLPEGAVELAGFAVDKEGWLALAAENDAKAKVLRDELQRELPSPSGQLTLFGYDPKFNLDSSPQLLKSLQKLGLTVDGKLIEDTSEATLSVNAGTFPIVKKLLDYREAARRAETFGPDFIKNIDAEGRVRCQYRGTLDTGRYSHSKPNLGQVPRAKQYRSKFRPPKGRKYTICVAEGTRVATSEGLRPIEEIRRDHAVLQEDGTTRRVLRWIDNGFQETVRVRTRQGYEIVCTPTHRFRVLDAAGEYVWREAGALRHTDALAVQPGRLGDDCLCPTLPAFPAAAHPLEHDAVVPAVVTPLFAEWCGYVCGDGSFGDTTLRWVVCDQDPDLAAHLRGVAATLFEREIPVRAYRGVEESWICGRRFQRWLRAVGIAKDRVPEYLWTSNAETVGAFLRGLFEADGSVGSTAKSRGWVSWGCIHERLAREVQELLLALGVVTTRSVTRHGKAGAGLLWQVRVPFDMVPRFASAVGFRSARKQARLTELLARIRASRKSGEVTSIPNIGAKMRACGFPDAAARALLNNTCFGRRPLGAKVAQRVRETWPEYAKATGLTQLLERGTFFDRIDSIEDAGERHVFDLTVEETSTYLAAGVVSHNCDYSNVEMVIAADQAQERVLQQLFRASGDAHKYLATKITGKCLDDITKDERQQAKPGNFGFLYGMGWRKFILYALVGYQQVFTPEKAQVIREAFFEAYPRFHPWHQEQLAIMRADRMVRTASGRLRWLDPDWSYSEAFNTPVQGTGADALKTAMRRVWRPLNDLGPSTVLPGRPAAQLVHHVHDELVVEHDDDADLQKQVAHIVETEMVAGLSLFLRNTPGKAEPSRATSWAEK